MMRLICLLCCLAGTASPQGLKWHLEQGMEGLPLSVGTHQLSWGETVYRMGTRLSISVPGFPVVSGNVQGSGKVQEISFRTGSLSMVNPFGGNAELRMGLTYARGSLSGRARVSRLLDHTVSTHESVPQRASVGLSFNMIERSDWTVAGNLSASAGLSRAPSDPGHYVSGRLTYARHPVDRNYAWHVSVERMHTQQGFNQWGSHLSWRSTHWQVGYSRGVYQDPSKRVVLDLGLGYRRGLGRTRSASVGLLTYWQNGMFARLVVQHDWTDYVTGPFSSYVDLRGRGRHVDLTVGITF